MMSVRCRVSDFAGKKGVLSESKKNLVKLHLCKILKDKVPTRRKQHLPKQQSYKNFNQY